MTASVIHFPADRVTRRIRPASQVLPEFAPSSWRVPLYIDPTGASYLALIGAVTLDHVCELQSIFAALAIDLARTIEQRRASCTAS